MELGGRFELLTLLGEGGMGAVWRARDRELDELVALKLIKPELATSGDMVSRFRGEVKLARRVTHRHVARIYELGSADGVCYFTMELIEGRSLATRLRAEGRLPWREAVAITAAIADGLDAAHAVGVVHRDIKPDNVLLEDGGRVVITDFGIAAARASAGSGIAGTPAYMAPEQAAGEPPTAAADVYAVGVVLYEMLTGVPPWRGSTAEIFAARAAHEALELGSLPDLEPALADVVRRATARDPALRLRSAAELRALLARWVDAAPAANRPARRRSDAAVRDLVVEAVSGNGDRRHIADAVYEQVVARLSQLPRARVVTAWKPEQRTAVACVVRIAQDGDAITVNACGTAGDLVSLRLPATATEAAAGGLAAASAIAASLGLADDESHPVGTPPEALELYLQARRLGRRLSAKAIFDALRLHEQALTLAPHDHRILAGHAMALARAVFVSKNDREPLDAAAAAAADAMVRAPERVETHIAAGQVALHQGDVVAAAGRLRHAIAIAPQAAEAHEWLGRLLLEAGHVDDGIARLETALSLDPRLELVQWEIARAAALDGDWDRYDRIARALIGDQRLASTPWAARFASWRGDREGALAVLRASDPQDAQTGFGPEFFRRIASAMTGAWEENREALLAMAAAPGQASERRNSMIGQLVAEAAGGVGDIETCAIALGHAMGHGFFDLHWLDKCPLLAKPRAAGVLDPMRPPVVARAQRILDALYGDSPSHNATADTMFATPTADTTRPGDRWSPGP